MKKILLVCLALFVGTLAFAQSAASTGLTDSDVQTFCKNYNKMRADFEKLGADMSDAQALALAVSGNLDAAKILNKYGISGSNSVQKLCAIAYGYAVERCEEELAADPETARLLKSMGQDPAATIRSLVADSDVKVVKRHLSELKKVFDED